MRLINIQSLELGDFTGPPPPYIILSHRWTEDEISYKDFVKGRRISSAGYQKISQFCKFVRGEQSVDQESGKHWFPWQRWQQWDNASGHFGHVMSVSWVWIDTVCRSAALEKCIRRS